MDFKLAGKENNKKKRGCLAPLPKRASPVKEKIDEPDDDLTNDQLAELFGAADAKDDTIDLDDWIPVGLKPQKEIREKSPLKTTNEIPAKEKPETYRSRTDMLFSSIEFEADSTLGLRFQKRKVPATKIKELSQTAVKVRLIDALKFSEKKTWFTFGVVSDYSEMRKSGGARIDITDLSAEPFSLRCLIFNSAFTELGKIEIGSIVCITNPTKAKPYNGKDALAVNTAGQILVAGSSRDFSLCNAKKKDGGICRNVVNTHICRYCKFHAISEYKNQKVGKDLRAVATGAGIQSNKPSTNSWNNKPVLKALTPARKNLAQIKKDQERLDKLNGMAVPGKRKLDEASPQPAKKPLIASTPPQRLSAAKRRALEYAKQNGGITHGKVVKKPVEIEPDEPKTPIHLSEKFLSMMKEKPRDADLASGAETAERNKKFERLEIIEEIGEKMAATHEVPVRAIRCLVCKKNYHQMPLQCVMNKHKCKVVAGTKRFFECNGCRTKTTTLEVLPVAECSKCGVWSWKRSGVAKNRVCNAAPQLSVRGLEETFVNSIVKEPNLNLLVPANE